MLLLSIVVAGFYPAIMVTSFKTSEVLKGKYVHSRSGIIVTRKALVAFQLLYGYLPDHLHLFLVNLI